MGLAPESGIRGRFRVYVRDEAKTIALRQLAEGGPQAVSVNAIAKELGMSGPALYRYFAGRDALFTELVTDAYLDLTAAVAAAVAPEADSDTGSDTGPKAGPGPRERLRDFAAAYRGWATAQPHRYRLLFAAPFPGYDAHAEELVAAAQRLMAVLDGVLAGLPGDEGPAGLGAGFDAWARGRAPEGAAPATTLRGLVTWSRLHGLVRLEIEGNYASMGLDPGVLFESEVAALLRTPVTGA
ncbi:TetR/AcrR family transcriptional regulator [Spirillospora sp. NBC_01491]|uniref:TetR/AcrR family transcriptional regulator n=1 Tax=Spirillospora sp. NBC_01491 TaxID=2976007 RepID=UPI002E2F0106|nr:TetR/AcrR family transcriptional regulator [Spirillospora sp. NBC_01491]